MGAIGGKIEAIVFLNINLPSQGMERMSFGVNEKVKDVLRCICNKFKLRSDAYQLSHSGKIVDMDKRVEELPAETVVTLLPVEDKKPRVLVELIADGQLSAGLFSESESLWDVYEKFGRQRQIPEKSVQISFLGRNFVGKTLLKKTKMSSFPYRRMEKIVLYLERSLDPDAGAEDEEASSTTVDERIPQETVRKAFSKPPNVKEIATKSKKQSERTIDDSAKKKESIEPRLLRVPSERPLLRGISSVDTRLYSSETEIVKGFTLLDKRNGITYNMRNRNFLGRTGLALLGLEEKHTQDGAKQGVLHLRIIFPHDRRIQASFTEDETVNDVYRFVTSVTRTSELRLCTRNADDGYCDLAGTTPIKHLKCTPEGTLFVKYNSPKWKIAPDPVPKDLLHPKVPRFEEKKKIWRLK